jgi:uncharacterized protein (DUF58 family)
MRLALLISIPLIILAIALTGTHILVERLFILIALIMLLSYIFARLGMWGLKGTLKFSDQHIQVNQDLNIEATAENTICLPKAFIKLIVKTEQRLQTDVVTHISTKGHFQWLNHIAFSRRGVYKLGPLVAETTDPFGLFHIHRKLDEGKDVLICPQTVELPTFWAESPKDTENLRNSQFIHETGDMISGVREYVPGDSLSRIHWKSTAHKGKLIVKEFEVDQAEKIWVILDLSQDSQWGFGIKTTEETMITIAASIVKKYADTNRQVGLITQNNRYHYHSARSGSQNMWQILENLAVIKADGQIPFSQVLHWSAEQFNSNSVAIVITAGTQVDLVKSVAVIKKRGIQVVVILLDAISFGGNLSQSALLSSLQAIKVPTYSVRQSDDIAEALNHQGLNFEDNTGLKERKLD